MRKRSRLWSASSVLAFFLGVSLTVGSLGQLVSRWAWERDRDQWWRSDWQETDAFRWAVSDYLEDFLTLSAGGELDWYGSAISQESGYNSIWDWEKEWGWPGDTAATYSAINTSYMDESTLDNILRVNPDYLYESNKNVLYRILRANRSVYESTAWYSNTEQELASYDSLPEGYNFLLTYQEGKVSIIKDGQELDVYGSGIYDENSLWYVPGYENFQVGAGVEGAKVSIAIRQVPIQYYQGNYGAGTVYQSNRLYHLYQDMARSQSAYRTLLTVLAGGLALLAVWFLLRRDRRAADAKLASWTVHVWTEVRFLLVAGCLTAFARSGIGGGWWYEFLYDGFYAGFPVQLARSLLSRLDNTPLLLTFVWLLWLIRNDHRHHPRTERRSLWRLVAVQTRKYGFQKRLAWWNRGTLFLACLPVVSSAALLYAARAWDEPIAVFLLCATLLCAAAVLLTLRGHTELARDAGLLADQVSAIREGDLEMPLMLPADAELRQTAENLNDIQAGMQKALAEQTRSERMKVELISNVSHDLKTPLTSILSYAELLRQEDLSPVAADYARIIDDKARRLKTMVQDVFDVSKATADQLPVHLERLDLGKLLRQTMADMADPIAQSPLTFKIDLPPEPVMIVADGKRLYRVFQNLIQNALQYALDCSRVYLTLKTGAGQAEATMRNTSRVELTDGVDFTARFVRGDESRTDGGSGLGLSIASSFTEACGGQFRVETVADLFTAVVTFPLAADPDSEGLV